MTAILSVIAARLTALRRVLHHSLMAITAALVLSASACSVFRAETLEPAHEAQLVTCITSDVSASFGLDSLGRRQAPSAETFAAAKRRLTTLLFEQILQEGDRIACLIPFTDQAVAQLQNVIPSGEIAVDSNGSASVRAQLNMLLDGLQLRDPRVRYTTLYRNSLDAALLRLTEVGAQPDQRLIILLTDEYGSEADKAWEISPEEFRHAYVLVLRAAPNGELTVTPNIRLRDLVKDDNATVAEYVEAVRDAYRKAHPVAVVRTRTGIVVGVTAALGIALLAGLLRVRRRQANERAPRLEQAFYSPQTRAVVLTALNLELPGKPEDYLIDDGTHSVAHVQRNGAGRVHIMLADQPAEGVHNVTVQTPTGPLRAIFGVNARAKQPQYQATVALISDLAADRSVTLGANEVELLEGFPRLSTSLRAKREGQSLVLCARRGRVRADDGTELLAPRSIDLEHAASRTLVFDLQDEDDAVEITVRRLA